MPLNDENAVLERLRHDYQRTLEYIMYWEGISPMPLSDGGNELRDLREARLRALRKEIAVIKAAVRGAETKGIKTSKN